VVQQFDQAKLCSVSDHNNRSTQSMNAVSSRLLCSVNAKSVAKKPSQSKAGPEPAQFCQEPAIARTRRSGFARSWANCSVGRDCR